MVTIKYYIDDEQLRPLYADSQCAGMDVRSAEGCVVKAGGSVSVSTGLRVHIPDGYVGYIKGRSGLNHRCSIVVPDGTIDSGYTGYIKVKLYNLSGEDYNIKYGDRIAQLVLHRFERADMQELDLATFDRIRTERGWGGFGSTGND